MASRWMAPILLQLVLACLALAIAWQIEPWLTIAPHAILGGPRATDPPGTLPQIVAWFLGLQGLSGGLGAAFRSSVDAPAASVVLRSFYAAIAGTALATLAIFLLTDLPFRSNLFLGIFLVLTVLFALVFMLALMAAAEPIAFGRLLRLLGESVPTVEFGVAAVSTAVMVVTLGAFWVSLDARNALNYLRSRESVKVVTGWQLVDRFAGARFNQPIDLVYPASEREHPYLLTRKGQVYRVDAQTGAAELALDLSSRIVNRKTENGALALALHPDFGVDGRPGAGLAYVWYTGFADDDRTRQVNRLSRFDLAAAEPAARLATETMLIECPRDPSGFHNGGGLLFGPDGMLFLSIGDLNLTWGGQDVSQRLAAGVVRIDVDQRGGEISAPITRRPTVGRTAGYFIPRDNPFFDLPGALQEYWAIGLRNPFRMWFDAEREALWIGDVGADLYEEINLLGAGGNGQWPVREGPELNDDSVELHPASTPLPPLHAYRQTSVLRAVIGGVVYQGDRLPELQGQYLFADNQAGVIFRLDPHHLAPGRVALARAPQLASYGITSITEAPDGELLVTTLGPPDEAGGRILALRRGAGDWVEDDAGETLGARVYQTYCVRCHGDDGRGGPATSALAARPDFSAAAWQARATDRRIAEVIRSGGAALGLSGDMPAWGEVLDDAELQAVLEHLRNLGPGA